MTLRRLIATAATGAAAVPAYAADAPSASPVGSQLLSLVLAMTLVLALIGACAWLVKRLSPRALAAAGILRVVAGVAVGQRERVVVVEVGETWLVLGVTPNGVNPLHQLPRGVTPPATAGAPTQTPFASWLKQFMEKRNGR